MIKKEVRGQVYCRYEQGRGESSGTADMIKDEGEVNYIPQLWPRMRGRSISADMIKNEEEVNYIPQIWSRMRERSIPYLRYDQ